MCVYHITDDSEFIISDNPVVIRPYADPSDPNFDHLGYLNQEIDPFAPSNMIQLPINTKTLFIILPKTEGQASGFLQRLDKEKLNVAIYNAETEANAEMWILETEKGLSNNDIYQEKLNEPNPENIKAAANFIRAGRLQGD